MLDRLKNEILQTIAADLSDATVNVFDLFEAPKDVDHGQLSLPVFFLAKQRRLAPPVIAKQLAEQWAQKKSKNVLRVEAVGGYVNFHFENLYLQNVLHDSSQSQADRLGYSDRGKSKTVVIDYSSPNVAKPMHVGHLRATVIGQAIVNLAKTQGYNVKGLNHLGDWGVQFGKCAWGYLNWKKDYDFETKPFESLYSIYTRFHQEAEKDPSLNEKGAATFKKLEEGDPEITKIWKMFVDVSMSEYKKIWEMMNVKHDLVLGESFYNNQLKPTEKLIEDKKLLEESEGAMVVRLDELKIPPCLIRKSDGASLYATRDLASAIYRHDHLKADVNLYVVGNDQSLHFKQVFAVLKKMGYDWSQDCHHISFGMYRFTDSKMSSRKGNVITLKELIEKAQALVAEVIEAKNPDLKDKQSVAMKVGLGALIFNDLMNDRVKDVEFNWDRALDFEGNSGPYVQYSLVRCLSLIKKYQKSIVAPQAPLETVEERSLVKTLLQYPDVLKHSFNQYKPHTLAMYLLDVCQAFNFFYHKQRVLAEDQKVTESRMSLVYCTKAVLENGLKVLNIPVVQEM